MANIGYMVDLDETPRVEDDEGAITHLSDGSVQIDDEPAPDDKGDAREHDANLAEFLSDSDLAKVADDLIERYESDKSGRADWERRLASGLRIAGLGDDKAGDGNWLSNVCHPMIVEAAVQFQARAMEELFPAAGPVKAVVVGDSTPEKTQQSERVADYMNYQVTEADPGWQDEDECLLFRLPFDGHGWKKVYYDARGDVMTSRFVPGENVFMPYSATSATTSPRLCHRQMMHANDVRFEQMAGNWRDVPLAETSGADEDRGAVREQIDSAEGSSPTEEGDAQDPARSREILEFYVDYNLPQFEHVGDDDDEPTGFALPYIITLDIASRQVLMIARNWHEGDERFRRQINLIAYKFLPGLGSYGFGFFHAIGGLAEAATGAVRAMLDSAHRNNVPGGFLANDIRLPAGTLSFVPGEWKPVQATAEELQKAFFTPPTHPVPDALFKLLSFLDESGHRFLGSTEALTGTAPSTGPVGTMVALIEQGTKVLTGIHKRLHKSKRDEYRLLARLNAMHVPEDGYPYDPGNEDRVIFAQDFGPAVDVLPVSDPNIWSAQQRIAIAQAQLELAQANPDEMDKRVALRRMLEAMKSPNIDELMPEKGVRPRRDPVAENMVIMAGQPAHAFADQSHTAHIEVHRQFMMHPGFGGHPDVQEIIAPLMAVHIQHHLSYLYQQQMMQAAGLPYVPVDVEGGEEEEGEGQIPPEMQEEIAVRAAMASEAFMQAQGLPEPPPDPAQAAAEQQMALKEKELEIKTQSAQMDQERKGAELQLKAQAAGLDMQMKQAGFTADEQRRMIEWMNEQRRAEQEHEAGMRRDEEAADQKLELDAERAEAQKKALKERGKNE